VFLLWRCLFHGNGKVEGLTDCNIYYDYGLFCLSIVGYALLRLIMAYVLLGVLQIWRVCIVAEISFEHIVHFRCDIVDFKATEPYQGFSHAPEPTCANSHGIQATFCLFLHF